ncbi:t-SNARE domain-containing protein 1-like isoform X2 [Rhinatrema bivittatum]|uniref:t-SNARE domain-containing protein 1-like isoform X2 n=1 Tax=Rhinatrema bivittatum TaxID=194408 RepID=UPI0011278984|nr:t-SNARE domain-containing protein 1-like isoform X2 [Rhinatrema bivittatum]
MTEDSPKRRKANFNEAETQVLIEQVLKHEHILFAAGSHRASPGQKRRIWEYIMKKVNPVAACPREVEDLKKRWRDLKRRDRNKVCRISEVYGGVMPLPEEIAAPVDLVYGPIPPEALPIVGGFDTLDLPGVSMEDQGFTTEDPGPSSQSCIEHMDLKEEIVVKIVEPEESSEDTAVVPPSQEQLPFLGTHNSSSSGKVKAKTKIRPQPEQNDMTEQSLLQLQQQQIRVIQAGFDHVNHNLRLLQHGMQELNNNLSVMAHTLMAIKNVYAKTNACPATYCSTSTQTPTGYLSPGSPSVKDNSRAQVTGNSSRSSSCSSSSMSQEAGPSDLPPPPLQNIKKEHANGCYYFCFADM